MHFDHLILTSVCDDSLSFFLILFNNDFTANVRTESNPTGETRVPRGRPTTGENPGLTSEARRRRRRTAAECRTEEEEEDTEEDTE